MKNLIVLGISLLLFWSCSNPGKTISAEDAEIHTEAHEAHHYNESSDALELNDGERWVVNEEMKPFVAKGSELVSSYIQDGETDFKGLADLVREENLQLVQSCTMTGKSHDELHKWLHPHMALVEELSQATNQVEADGLVRQLEVSYDDYHQYFQ